MTEPFRPTDLMRLQNIHVTLTGGGGAVNVLRGIDLTLREGERVALLGPSGSGKTTMLMTMAGLEPPTEGKIWFRDQDLTRMSDDAVVQWRGRHVGIVFQAFHLIPTMTALENVALTLELLGRRNAMAGAAAALADVGLAHRVSHFPAQLSGGEQQRVAIARGLVADPALLLADEPTGNLDGETGDHVMQLLFDRQKTRQTGLLLVTHDPDLARRCDRVLHMKDGQLRDDERSPVENIVAAQ